MKLARNLFLAIAVLCIVGACVYAFVPWKSLLEKRLIDIVAGRGFANIAFNIDQIGLNHARLVNVVIGKDHPLILKSVEFKFTPKDLLAGSLEDIVLEGMAFEVRQGETGWRVTGLDVKTAGGSPGKTDFINILSSLPFRSLTLRNSTLSVVANNLSGVIPLTATLTPKALAINTEPSDLQSGSNSVSLGAASIALAADDKDTVWKGVWTLAPTSVSDSFPPMAGKGDISLSDTAIEAGGKLTDQTRAYTALIIGRYDLADSAKTGATLKSATIPFKDGKVSIKNVPLALPATAQVTIQKVSVDALMGSLTGDRVNATGTLSGTVPVTIRKDGSYAIGKGTLKADGAGTIQISGDLIPSEQEQVALVRQILENLHYSVMSAQVQNSKNGKMTVKLVLEGNNPDVYNGRAVKLTVNLTGDILDFIQQNLMLFNSPEKLIEQDGR